MYSEASSRKGYFAKSAGPSFIANPIEFISQSYYNNNTVMYNILAL
jgi:hypothetical protein